MNVVWSAKGKKIKLFNKYKFGDTLLKYRRVPTKIDYISSIDPNMGFLSFLKWFIGSVSSIKFFGL